MNEKHHAFIITQFYNAFDSMLEERELDAAIAEAEAEYDSDDKLIDAREALSRLKRKHFGK